jgi:hypothetical protein
MKTVNVKPTGAHPVPLPQSMRKPGRMFIPVSGATVTLTRFIQRRLDANDLVEVPDAPAPTAKPAPAAPPAPAVTPAKES